MMEIRYENLKLLGSEMKYFIRMLQVRLVFGMETLLFTYVY